MEDQQWQSVDAQASSDLATDGIVWFDWPEGLVGGGRPLELAECLIVFSGDPGACELYVTDGTSAFSPRKSIASNGTDTLAFTVGGTIPVPPGVTALGIACTPSNAVTFVAARITARLRGSV